ncbi:MAG: glycosyltransferase family 2 protein [Verrucomicrobiota bacterium]|nr:glycosyltransferase family 2 protein [Verrucomicrobiota bacterium]
MDPTPPPDSAKAGGPPRDYSFALDEPVEWSAHVRHLRLSGWCVANNRAGAPSIRAKIRDTIFPGRFDRERPDVLAYLGTRDAPLCCGFTIDVRVPRGRSRLQLQASLDGESWRTLLTREVEGPLISETPPSERWLAADLALAQPRFDLSFARPTDWSAISSPLYLAGWVVDRTGGWIHGIRASIGGRTFVGTHGIVREDVGAIYPDNAAARRSGFACRVELPNHAAKLLLEIRQVDGPWRPVFREDVAAPDQRRAVVDMIDPTEAAFFEVDARPRRFEFSVDAPAAWTALDRELHLAGWCVAAYGEQISKLRVRVGSKIFAANYGALRPDIALAFEGRAAGLRSGFTADITLPRGRSRVVLEARSAHGAWEPVVQRVARVPLFRRQRKGLHEPIGDYEKWISRYDTQSRRDRASIRRHIASFARRPRFSVLLPAFNSDARWLRRAIASVRAQLYPDWELCVVDDASTDPQVWALLCRAARRDARIKAHRRDLNGHICAASNDALELATGEFVALLDHDDELAPTALYYAAERINREPALKLLYSDEDKLDRAGRRCDPHFKSDWNPDLLRSQNYVSHLGFYDRALVLGLGGFRAGFEGAQDYDLVLRCSERLAPDQIAHIPRVLYHWRMAEGSSSAATTAKPYANDAALRAVQEHLDRTTPGATVEPHRRIYLRARYPLPAARPLVSLIIPTRDRAALLQRLIVSVLDKTEYSNFEIVVLDNDSEEPETLQILQELKHDPRVRVHRIPGDFNYSRLNNLGVVLARGAFVVLMNNDLEVMHGDWLGEMLSHAARPRTGAVGARLWYPDGSLQHAGVIIGAGGVASHIHGGTRGADGYFSRMHLTQNYSAATGACMLLRTETYTAMGGLDEINLAVAFNDVDLCLRLRAAGYYIVWTPHAEFIHHESASRGIEDTSAKQRRFLSESQYMRKKWGSVLDRDQFYNPNLSLGSELFQLAFPSRTEDPWKLRPI